MFRCLAMFILAAVVSVPLVSAVPQNGNPVCDGEGVGITNDFQGAGDTRQVNVYGNDCTIIQSLTGATSDEICNQGVVECSPPPVPYSSYTSSDGTTYTCHRAGNSDSCEGIPIAACCYTE